MQPRPESALTDRGEERAVHYEQVYYKFKWANMTNYINNDVLNHIT